MDYDVAGRSRPDDLMFLARRPSQDAIERFTAESREQPLSYNPVGIAKGRPAGRTIDETAVVIGRGERDFERAKAALSTWRHFDIGWIEVFPRKAPTEPGTIVTVLVHHLGFWSLNGCRVVYGTGDRDGGARFGFAYGTLANHAESGEEVFEVVLDPVSNAVSYRIRAVSRPRAALAWLGYPVARALQARFRRDSGEAMTRATQPALRQVRSNRARKSGPITGR